MWYEWLALWIIGLAIASALEDPAFFACTHSIYCLVLWRYEAYLDGLPFPLNLGNPHRPPH